MKVFTLLNALLIIFGGYILTSLFVFFTALLIDVITNHKYNLVETMENDI